MKLLIFVSTLGPTMVGTERANLAYRNAKKLPFQGPHFRYLDSGRYRKDNENQNWLNGRTYRSETWYVLYETDLEREMTTNVRQTSCQVKLYFDRTLGDFGKTMFDVRLLFYSMWLQWHRRTWILVVGRLEHNERKTFPILNKQTPWDNSRVHRKWVY